VDYSLLPPPPGGSIFAVVPGTQCAYLGSIPAAGGPPRSPRRRTNHGADSLPAGGDPGHQAGGADPSCSIALRFLSQYEFQFHFTDSSRQISFFPI